MSAVPTLRAMCMDALTMPGTSPSESPTVVDVVIALPAQLHDDLVQYAADRVRNHAACVDRFMALPFQGAIQYAHRRVRPLHTRTIVRYSVCA